MQQAEQALKHEQQGVARAGRGVGVIPVQRGLGEFDEPVAELVPRELVQGLREQVEAVVGEVLRRFVAGACELRQDPFLGIGARLGCTGKHRAFGVHQHEPRGVPQLVAEVLVALGAGEIELDVAAMCSQRADGEAQCIGAERGDAVRILPARGFLDLRRVLRIHQSSGALGHQRIQRDAIHQVDRIEHVALRLGHLLALRVAHQPGDVDVLERDLPGEVVGHHDHPGDPEENDVEAGDQHARRHVSIEPALGHQGFVGPAHRAEGPQCRREPRLEHVVIAAQRHSAAIAFGRDRTCVVLAARDDDVARVVVPRRNPVAPPELAADAPVLDVLHPMAIGVDPVGGHEAHVTVVDQLHASGREAVHLHEPLVGEIRLDDLTAAVAEGLHERFRIDQRLAIRIGHRQAICVDGGNDARAGFVTVKVAQFGRHEVDRRDVIGVALTPGDRAGDRSALVV